MAYAIGNRVSCADWALRWLVDGHEHRRLGRCCFLCSDRPVVFGIVDTPVQRFEWPAFLRRNVSCSFAGQHGVLRAHWKCVHHRPDDQGVHPCCSVYLVGVADCNRTGDRGEAAGCTTRQCNGPSRRVSFLRFEGRHCAGSATDRQVRYLLGLSVPRKPASIHDISVGSFYEDCAFHPCLCIAVWPEHGSIRGISLVDGSFPRGCDIDRCGIRILTAEEAITWRLYGPQDVPPEIEFCDEDKWWLVHRQSARQYWPEPGDGGAGGR
jgi:hypothetical protein